MQTDSILYLRRILGFNLTNADVKKIRLIFFMIKLMVV
ncbi:hypothetical protein DSUL_50375 [Desulfovibrionales bacterium]